MTELLRIPKKYWWVIVVSMLAFGCKPKKQVIDNGETNKALDTGSVIEMPLPGVPNQHEYDSLKKQLDEERRRRDSLR